MNREELLKKLVQTLKQLGPTHEAVEVFYETFTYRVRIGSPYEVDESVSSIKDGLAFGFARYSSKRKEPFALQQRKLVPLNFFKKMCRSIVSLDEFAYRLLEREVGKQDIEKILIGSFHAYSENRDSGLGVGPW